MGGQNIMGRKAIAICLVICLVSAGVTFANLVDLSVNTSGTVTAATGQSTIFERYNDPLTGTGVFNPFVRIQGNGIEKGYNTDGSPEFDTKGGKWTRSLRVGDILVSNGNIQFLLDINQSQGGNKRYLSLDVMKIYLADSGDLDSYASGLGTLIYDLGNNWVKMDNTIFNPGSGTGDMRVTIPVNPGWSSDKYLYLYSEFGQHNSANGGFEEWAIIAAPAVVPEPATLALGLGVLSLLRNRSRKLATR
jgi:hypothetical protein